MVGTSKETKYKKLAKEGLNGDWLKTAIPAIRMDYQIGLSKQIYWILLINKICTTFKIIVLSLKSYETTIKLVILERVH